MQHRVAIDPADVEDETIVSVCPSCAARARAFAQPSIRGVKMTSVVVFGVDGREGWTVLATRAHNLVAKASAATEEEAVFEVLSQLGVLG